MNLWLLFLILGLCTLAERYSFLIFLGDWKMPALMVKALRYVPVVVLFALASPAILRTDNMIDISLNPKIIAGIVAVLIAWRTRSILYTIVGGMAIFWLSRWLLAFFAG